jgi:predicted RNase H-like HicB family nuclease
MVEYEARFLCWWGVLLFCCKLGSRRQLDYELRDDELPVLDNVNRLAHTQQVSLPVHKTLSHFLGHVGSHALAQLRTDCVRRLIRNKVLDDARLEGCFVLAVDDDLLVEREGEGYVALCPEFDVASQGDTVEDARRNLAEAVALFLETADPSEINRRERSEIFVTRLEVPVG